MKGNPENQQIGSPLLSYASRYFKIKHGRIIFKSRPCLLLTVTEQTIDTLLT